MLAYFVDINKAMEVVSNPIVTLKVSSSSKSQSSFISERKFDRGINVSQLKNKLEMIVGMAAVSMTVQVFDEQDKLLMTLDEDDRLIGSYQIDDGMRIHVIGQSMLEEFDNVDKYEMSDDLYDNKEGTVRSIMKKRQIGKYNPELQEKRRLMQEKKKEEDEMFMQQIKVGSRCEIQVPGKLARRGVVSFVGFLHSKQNLFVGVSLDEPTGSNDGSFDGKRYFTCRQGYGSFVRPTYVTCGDFPEFDLDDEM